MVKLKDSIRLVVFLLQVLRICGDFVNGSFVVTSFAGGGALTGESSSASTISLNFTNDASGMILETSSNMMYFAEPARNRIRSLNMSTGVVSVVAGTGASGAVSGSYVPATSAVLNYPRSMCIFQSTMYVVEMKSHCIRKVNLETGVIQNYIGICGTSGTATSGTGVLFNGPVSCVVDSAGVLYVSDGYSGDSCRLRRITSSTSALNYEGDGNCGPTTNTNRISTPWSMAFDSSGYLYFGAEMTLRRVTMTSTSAGTMVVYAGSTTSGLRDSTTLTSALCTSIRGVWIDSVGAIYFTDKSLSGDDVIRYIPKTRNSVGTIAYGKATYNEFQDGVPLWNAYFNDIIGLTGDTSGFLYISTRGTSSNSRVRKASFPPPTPVPTVNPTFAPSATPTFSPTFFPSSQPTRQPSSQPTRQPSSQPTRQPSSQPTRQPSSQPTRQPSSQPTRQPSSQPTRQPSSHPTRQPSSHPTRQPSSQPTRQPSSQPTGNPTQPTSNPSSSHPSSQPTTNPSFLISKTPTIKPTHRPTSQPTSQPSKQPQAKPSNYPSSQPSSFPSSQPTSQPTDNPTLQPVVAPSNLPSTHPTSMPSVQPSMQPITEPSSYPTTQPSNQPSGQPRAEPSLQPVGVPTGQPTSQPSSQPSSRPSSRPMAFPSSQPTSQPTWQPSSYPTNQPTEEPTSQPSSVPSTIPSIHPSTQPTKTPSNRPSSQPTEQPQSYPSWSPTDRPSSQPSGQPSSKPSVQPSLQPSAQPSNQPSFQPTNHPTLQPSSVPSVPPTQEPSCQPSSQPTCRPTSRPSIQPSRQPVNRPSCQPSSQPSKQPLADPTCHPSFQPTHCPTSQPSEHPSSYPSSHPSSQPSWQPTNQPSSQPSTLPSSFPTSNPSPYPSCQPTKQPTTQPSRQPTSKPSRTTELPTSQPTISPTSQPTEYPSSNPSIQPVAPPSTVPSTIPTVSPSTIPSSQPSSHPSNQLSSFPTAKPSNQPSLFPSSQPSASPTMSPTDQPTKHPNAVPTGQPISHPTRNPSHCPTSNPSVLPSTNPSTQPLAYPTSQPTSNPTCLPISSPTINPSSTPTSQPSTIPTATPSSLPSGNPSHSPSSQPSMQPTSKPSSLPSCQPASIPTASPSMQSLSVPSSQPSSQPTLKPSTQPSAQPSSQPSRQPSSQPSSRPTISIFRDTSKSFLIGSFSPFLATISVSIKVGKDILGCSSPLPAGLSISVVGLSSSTWYPFWVSSTSFVLHLFYHKMEPFSFKTTYVVIISGCGISRNISINPLYSTGVVSARSQALCMINSTSATSNYYPACRVNLENDISSSMAWPWRNISWKTIDNFASTSSYKSKITPRASNSYLLRNTVSIGSHINVSTCNIAGRCGTSLIPISLQPPLSLQVQIYRGHTGSIVYRSSQLYFYSSIISLSLIRSNLSLDYQWLVTDTVTSSKLVFSNNMDSSIIVLKPYILSANTNYLVSLHVYDRKTSLLLGNGTIAFGIVADPIVGILQPRQSVVYISVGEKLVLDGSLSFDLNEPVGNRSLSNLRFSWQCLDDPGNMCWLSSLNSTSSSLDKPTVLLRVSSNSVEGAMFRVRMSVRDRAGSNRQSDVTTLVVVKKSTTPRLDIYLNTSLSLRNLPLTSDSVIKVMAQSNRSMCSNSTSCNMGWSLLYQMSTKVQQFRDVTQFMTTQVLSNMGVASFSLSVQSMMPNALYIFRIAIMSPSSPSTVVAFSDVDVATNRAPFGGRLLIWPAFGGVAMETIFDLNAAGWKDDVSDYPFIFEFRYFLLNRWWMLHNQPHLSFIEDTLLPYNRTLNIKIAVSDIWAASTTDSAIVSLSAQTGISASDVLLDYWSYVNSTYASVTHLQRTSGLLLVNMRSDFLASKFSAAMMLPLVTQLQNQVNQSLQRTDESMKSGGVILLENINFFRLQLQLQSAKEQLLNQLFAPVSNTSSVTNGKDSLNQANNAFDSLAPLLLDMLTASSGGDTTINSISISTDTMTASFSVISFGSNSQNGTSPTSVSLSVPNSANAVSIGTDGSSASGLMVSLVQLDAASMREALRNVSGSASSNKTNDSLQKAILSSDILTIQLVFASTNGSKSTPSLPTFDASLKLTGEVSSMGPTVLRHNCTVGVMETISMKCTQSDVIMNLTCTGEVAASVKRSCPVPKHVCSVLNLADNTVASNDYCQALVVGDSVLCRCGYTANGNSGNTSSNAALLALNGRISVAAFSSFATGELDSSVAISTAALGANIAGQSIVVFVTFSCFWGLGVLFIGWQYMRSYGYLNNIGSMKKQNQPSAITTPTVMQSRELDTRSDGFYSYLVTILPPSLASSDPWWKRLRTTLFTRHLYFRAMKMVFFGTTETYEDSKGVGRANGKTLSKRQWEASQELEEKRMKLDILQILTALTMSCFVLAVLYDLQYPTDDGYCGIQPDKSSCLVRKSLLDPWRSRCVWDSRYSDKPIAATIVEMKNGKILDVVEVDADNSADIKPCHLNDVNSSQVAFISSFFITSLFATILDFFLDYAFDILKADLSKNAKAREVAKVALHQRQIVPLTNENATSSASNVGESLSLSEEVIRQANLANETHDAPEPVSSTSSVVYQASSYFFHVFMYLFGSFFEDDKQEKLVIVLVPANVHQARNRWITSAASVERAGGPNGRTLPLRKRAGYRSTVVNMPFDVSNGNAVQPILQNELFNGMESNGALHRSLSKQDYHISLASDAEFGVALLHVLVADAVEALSGSEEKRKIVLHTIRRCSHEIYFVQEAWQYLLMFILLVMNGGAFYFIITKAAMRGVGWQFAFMRACVWEWFTEIFIVEVMECILLDYVLPTFVYKELLQCISMFVHIQQTRMNHPSASEKARSSLKTKTFLSKTSSFSEAMDANSNCFSSAMVMNCAIQRPTLKESKFAMVCEEYMESRMLRQSQQHRESFQMMNAVMPLASAPNHTTVSIPSNRLQPWYKRAKGFIRLQSQRLIDWYCGLSASMQETLINVTSTVVVALGIYFWFSVVQPALQSDKMVVSLMVWLVFLCILLYISWKLLYSLKTATPMMIAPWLDPVDVSDTKDKNEPHPTSTQEIKVEDDEHSNSNSTVGSGDSSSLSFSIDFDYMSSDEQSNTPGQEGTYYDDEHDDHPHSSANMYNDNFNDSERSAFSQRKRIRSRSYNDTEQNSAKSESTVTGDSHSSVEDVSGNTSIHSSPKLNPRHRKRVDIAPVSALISQDDAAHSPMENSHHDPFYNSKEDSDYDSQLEWSLSQGSLNNSEDDDNDDDNENGPLHRSPVTKNRSL